MESPNCILITGTTSGIGLGLMQHYLSRGWRVVAVNRRRDPDLEAQHPGARFHVIDISSVDAVRSLLKELWDNGWFPKIFILNAGVNKPDLASRKFDFPVFQEMISVNLYGTFSFVAAARELVASGSRFIGISSTSNIVPNTAHFGYALSKLGVHEGFKMAGEHDPGNSYGSVVLGPVMTRITRHYSGPQGLGRIVLRAIRAEVGPTVQAIARFSEGKRQVLRYPFFTWLFYYLMKLVFMFKSAKLLK
jgi:NAD(P)-dependent dehydrogenase (short-subunit alcohol dehydrogenase family)